MRHDLHWAMVIGVTLGALASTVGVSLVTAIQGERSFVIQETVQRVEEGEVSARLFKETEQRGEWVNQERFGMDVMRTGRPDVRLVWSIGTPEPGSIRIVDGETVRWTQSTCDRVDVQLP